MSASDVNVWGAMTDLQHDLLFGLFLTPDAGQPEQILELARLADTAGLDLLGVQDHPYQPRFLDMWTLLSVVASQTRRIRLFPDVVNLPFRPPAVLARAAAGSSWVLGAGHSPTRRAPWTHPGATRKRPSMH